MNNSFYRLKFFLWHITIFFAIVYRENCNEHIQLDTDLSKIIIIDGGTCALHILSEWQTTYVKEEEEEGKKNKCDADIKYIT